ncbi:MAG: hypothetical protein QOE92_149 [Chloroflexota bacterium]|nr:hypothetical protein [Chloroflexota bacterium]
MLAAEVAIGVAAAFAGWQLVARDGLQVPVLTAPPITLPAPPDVLGIPWAAGAEPGARQPGPRLPGFPGLPGGDFFTALGREDLLLYREETRAIQVLVDGVREYLLGRVLPAVNAAQGR